MFVACSTEEGRFLLRTPRSCATSEGGYQLLCSVVQFLEQLRRMAARTSRIVDRERQVDSIELLVADEDGTIRPVFKAQKICCGVSSALALLKRGDLLALCRRHAVAFAGKGGRQGGFFLQRKFDLEDKDVVLVHHFMTGRVGASRSCLREGMTILNGFFSALKAWARRVERRTCRSPLSRAVLFRLPNIEELLC